MPPSTAAIFDGCQWTPRGRASLCPVVERIAEGPIEAFPIPADCVRASAWVRLTGPNCGAVPVVNTSPADPPSTAVRAVASGEIRVDSAPSLRRRVTSVLRSAEFLTTWAARRVRLPTQRAVIPVTRLTPARQANQPIMPTPTTPTSA
jgi:hypothetical protein